MSIERKHIKIVCYGHQLNILEIQKPCSFTEGSVYEIVNYKFQEYLIFAKNKIETSTCSMDDIHNTWCQIFKFN